MGKSSTPNSFFLPFFSSTPYNCHRLPGQNNYTEFFKTPYTLQKTSINMKFFSQLLVLGLAAEATVASSWFSKSVYNKWHETELERWLSDHNVPYPTPYDRAQLETAVKDNWQTKVSRPRTLPQTTLRVLSLRSRSIGMRLRTRPKTLGRVLRIGFLTAGLSHSSRPSQTSMVSLFLSPVPEILFSRRYAPAMRLLPKRLARLLRTPATGFTNPGLSLISRSGSIYMAFPLRNQPPATS